MWYKTYASRMYAKISIPIYVGSIVLNIYSGMTYVSIQKFGQGNSVSNPLDNTYIFLFIYFRSHNIGPEIKPQRCHIFLLYFIFFFYPFGDWEVVGSIPHNLTLFFI